ncbi:MAG: hypothetical protein RML93_02610 [Anaerolineales bacterium]|nr:hypothetical protein [Anaerolineales bacterium]MCS7248189.1 hypothetical protein [Anaerolineales bacterium]MDW8162002.1 hypothetical protein [Anaerolineales bacterium]MDW8446165.1 hypothetical protein [Anaerolineales bacterium]
MKLTPYRIAIIILTLATAFIHFSLLFPDTLFILNGLGYLAFLAAYFAPVPLARQNHRLVKIGFVAYTAITILAWIAIGTNPPTVLGLITKIIEVLLIVCILSDRE